MANTFWFLLFIVFYSFLGYGIILYFLVKLKRIFIKQKPKIASTIFEPMVTMFVAAYNEKDYIKQKNENFFALNYPKDKVQFVWVTDGSDDGTPELLAEYPNVEVYHKQERNGKIAAINRGMQFVKTPIVIFSDANTLLGLQSIREIVKLFQDLKVGCVAGEKRIFSENSQNAAGSGEGFYWNYESKLKKWDAELYSVVGAAGELFAIRTELFEPVEKDTLLDDFIISLRLAQRGYTTQYSPDAYAIETSSADTHEEMKRKIRIAAGGIQSIIRLRALLNIFKYGILSFQYISHRVLRWTISPVALVLLFPLNFLIIFDHLSEFGLYQLLFVSQILFYLLAFLGFALENKKMRIKIFFIPYYFCMMNYCVIKGIIRYFKKNQSVNWERAKRAKS